MSTSDLPQPAAAKLSVRERLRRWMRTLHHDSTAEELAMEAHRQKLLDDLARAVAEAPDDVPIKEVIERLNRQRGD